tara:strand:- start:1465 stop:1746 length:282 start_codon:yes stop_codon:yes gene_type:complete
MKTLNDLILLIAVITVNNEGKQVQYNITLDLQYKNLSLQMYSAEVSYDDVHVDGIDEMKISHKSIKTTEQIQEVYWTLYNECGARANPSFQEI